jgi:cytosine/adenosine deaminase-related metal-dependent hydrolase
MYTVSEESPRRAAEFATAHDRVLHIHLCETEPE